MAKLQQKLELGQKLTPQQVLQANILQLNTTLLEQRILQELELNDWEELLGDPDEFDYRSLNKPRNQDYIICQ